MINRVTIVGRITKDPVLRSSVKNKKFVAFTVAVNNLNDNPDYISCFAWNKTAENMAKFLKKGAMVGVDGSIHSRRTERNGINTTELFITAMRVAFLEPKRNTTIETNDNEVDHFDSSPNKTESDDPDKPQDSDAEDQSEEKVNEDDMIKWS